MTRRSGGGGGSGGGSGAVWRPREEQVTAAASEFVPTEEQRDIFTALLDGDKHVIVNAVAGSGKSTTIVEYSRRERVARVGLVAFNKHIATELTQRTKGQVNVEAMTYHSLGYRALRREYGGLKVDGYRLEGLVEPIVDGWAIPDRMRKGAMFKLRHLVGLGKQYGFRPGVTDRERWEWLAEWHDIDIDAEYVDRVFESADMVLDRCAKVGREIDFDDMIWLPMVKDIPLPQFDILCVDEYQDTSVPQQWLATGAGARVCAVGDVRQGIYSWRGATMDCFDRLTERLGRDNVISLPLTLNRRCPKSHIRLAQVIVPQIRAREEAEEGTARVEPMIENAILAMRPGDLVLCRVNAELLSVAYRLIRIGVKAVVRGRDIGKGLLQLIEKAEKSLGRGNGRGKAELPDVLDAARDITVKEIAKFESIPHGRGAMRAANAQDRMDCLLEVSIEAATVLEVKNVIDSLFADFEVDGTPKFAVILGTVHRTKGLEADRVWVLRPDLIPHPMAKRPDDIVGEENCAYIAVTRARKELVWIGAECGYFTGGTNG